MELARAYHRIIDLIVGWSGSANLMHVQAGLAIFLAVQLVLRDRRGSMVALHVVFACEMGNEALDWLAALPHWTLADTLSDVMLTMMWPVAITAVSHYRRRRWQRAAAQQRHAVPHRGVRTARASA